MLAKQMIDKFDNLDRSKPIMFMCVGTPLSLYDGIAPRIGSRLYEEGVKVLGTVNNPITMKAINEDEELKEEIEMCHKLFNVIAIDIAQLKSCYILALQDCGFKPRAFENEDYTIGHKSILVNVDNCDVLTPSEGNKVPLIYRETETRIVDACVDLVNIWNKYCLMKIWN